MGKTRVYELAKDLHLSSKDLVTRAQKLGYDIKNHMATLDDHQVTALRQAVAPKPVPPVKAEQTAKKNQISSTAKQADDGKTKIKMTSVRRPFQKLKHEEQHQSEHRSQTSRPTNRRTDANSTTRSNNSANFKRSNTTSRPGQSSRTGAQSSGATHNLGAKHLMQYKQQAVQTQKDIQERRHQEIVKRRQEKEAQARKKQEAAKKSQASTPTHRPTTSTSKVEQTVKSQPTSVERTQPATAATDTRHQGKNFKRHDRYAQNERNEMSDRNRKRQNKKNRRRQNQTTRPKEAPKRKDRPLPEVLTYTVGMNAQDLGKLLHREPVEIVKKLFMLGVMVNQNQSLDKETIELLATDYGISAAEKIQEDIADIDTAFEEELQNTDNLESRSPVVTIMGHVDHGKTTLLDHLRHSHVTAGEAGGITQHIGAYQVKLNGRLITFLDTPGHAAFTNMRARGADVTDIVVLVVAADDGVMPQTIEAINHAKAAKDPIIVAVNKIDKPGANPNHVMEQLAEYELVPESWGGDTIFVEISAKMGTNIDELLEMILLEADILELKANPKQRAIGTVLEAKLDKGRGPVASLLVQQGTLHVGDPIVVGNTFGRVRVMTNDRGRRVKSANPSEPVEITGLNGVPDSADRFVVFEDEKSARSAGEERAKRAAVEERNRYHHVTLDNLFETMKEGELKEVGVIIKGDVQGSVEALAGSLQKIDVSGVRVNIIHQAVGAINESDVTLASASDAIIIGFNVRPTPQAKQQASEEDVDIRLHRVIYRAIEEIESAMKGMLEPVYEEKVTGSLVVRETYKVSKIGTVAGSFVNSGFIRRDSGVRLIRNGIVVYEGKLASLKRYKDDVKEVKAGFDCGLTIENYNDIKVDDELEAYIMEEVSAE